MQAESVDQVAAIQKAIETLARAPSSDIDEIGVVFDSSAGLKVVVEGTKLGLPHKLIPILFKHIKSIEDEDARLFISLTCSGDNYTAWARRKEILRTKQSSIQQELRVVDLILSKQPKSGGAWEHRRYLAEEFRMRCTSQNELFEFFRTEIGLCERVCKRHPRTYFAWSHRAWLTGWIPTSMLHEDFTRTKDWIDLNLSDASAFGHLIRLLNLLTERSAILALKLGARLKLIMDELMWCSSLSETYVGHEAIWSYRRGLSRLLLSCVQDMNKLGPNELKKGFKSVDFTCPLDHTSRFESYRWWLHNCEAVVPNIDVILQVLIDELSVSLSIGLGETMPVEYEAALVKKVRMDRKLSLAFSGWLSKLILEELLLPASIRLGIEQINTTEEVPDEPESERERPFVPRPSAILLHEQVLMMLDKIIS